MAKANEYQCETCAKFGNCAMSVYMALVGRVLYCGKWETDYKTAVKVVK